MMNIEPQNNKYNELIEQIGDLLKSGRMQIANSVNNVMVQTYWHVGQYIVEFEQQGSHKAEYGKGLMEKLSRDLTLLYGKGFSRSNLFLIRQLYIQFPKIQTLSGKLSWSHYVEILKLEDSLEIGFYIAQCERDNWSVRELKRQKNSMLFHRLALSKDKEGVL